MVPSADLAVASGLPPGSFGPRALQANVARHNAGLACLAGNLRSAGLDERQIGASLAAIAASYRAALIAAAAATLKDSKCLN